MTKDICLEFLMANIRASYYQALQHSTVEYTGMTWYHKANQEAARIARVYNLETDRVCGIIAALSPNNKWLRNLTDADALLTAMTRGKHPDEVRCCTYNGNKLKAWQIASGGCPNRILAGNKVRSFYQCLTNPQDNRTVCIDTHAINIALGRLAPIAKTPNLNDQHYAQFALAYRSVAWHQLEIPLLPMQVQAITWVYYRAVRGIDNSIAA